jgi:hypothetical protein
MLAGVQMNFVLAEEEEVGVCLKLHASFKSRSFATDLEGLIAKNE